ncbi:cAMP-binding domain of CRP or a regulatory subunit of cAMP-dependent protein kinases [Pedobacter westerhofensis]|uniref:cAMP-binding domain of CRP or a regulatory subunit of cAMP-dependent protein kinases n=1 Tax=Pedobacter westerhofensis TaxID=425512 RepID=A0A521CXQ2_9SPHI|nr:Crp/Fnr family transcriptional regulator [Pedobacter westerhofensis]SMO64233.1 cAMP-binding domain of CRP or a regulatory subunit of cAMP-dependent protein kinases [Pedobacter westerhofensis]
MDQEALHHLIVRNVGLSEQHFESFLSIRQTRTLAKKELLVKEGSICNMIGFIHSGLMRSFVRGDGEEHNTDFYFDGYLVSAYSSMVTQLPSDHLIEALTETQLSYISLDDYNNLVSNDIAWLQFGKYVAEFFLIRKCKREIALLKLSAAERLEDMRKTYPGIEQLISQYHIASYLGIKPQSLSRLKFNDTLGS